MWLTGYDETGFTRPGACADLPRIPARLQHVLPDGADLRAAALIEPAGCMATAVLAAVPVPGERVAVVGGGTLGLLAVRLLATTSPAELVVVDSRGRPATWSVASTPCWRRPGRAAPGGWPSNSPRAVRAVLAGLYGGVDEDTIAPAALVASAVTVRTVFGATSRSWSHAVHTFAGMLRPLSLVSDELVLEDAGRVLHPESPSPSGKVLLPLSGPALPSGTGCPGWAGRGQAGRAPLGHTLTWWIPGRRGSRQCSTSLGGPACPTRRSRGSSTNTRTCGRRRRQRSGGRSSNWATGPTTRRARSPSCPPTCQRSASMVWRAAWRR